MERIQYLVDNSGNRTAVVVPLEGNEAAVEDFLEDLYGSEMIQRRRSEETISKDDLLKGLRDDGLQRGLGAIDQIGYFLTRPMWCPKQAQDDDGKR